MMVDGGLRGVESQFKKKSMATTSVLCKRRRFVNHEDWAVEQAKAIGAQFFETQKKPIEAVNVFLERFTLKTGRRFPMRVELMEYLFPESFTEQSLLELERVFNRQLDLYVQLTPYHQAFKRAFEVAGPPTMWESGSFKYWDLPTDEELDQLSHAHGIPREVMACKKEFLLNGMVFSQVGHYRASRLDFQLMLSQFFQFFVEDKYGWELYYCQSHAKFWGRFSCPEWGGSENEVQRPLHRPLQRPLQRPLHRPLQRACPDCKPRKQSKKSKKSKRAAVIFV